MGAFFHLFGQLYLALGTNPRSQFLAYVFLENGLWSESLESLIGFLAYLEANLWLKNHILFKNKKVSRKVQFLLLRQILVSHNSAADWAKELFKLSEKPTKSCSLEWKKKSFQFWVFGRWYHDWGMFCSSFDSVISQSNEPILWLKVLLETRL